MTSIFSKLKILSVKHPLITDMVTFGCVLSFGSFIQQNLEGRRPGNYDWRRCFRFGIYGSVFAAPSAYGWVRLTTAMWPDTSLRAAIWKTALDQISYSPLSVANFFFTMSILEGYTFSESALELKEKFVPSYVVCIHIWPICQTINFSIIPEEKRVLFVSFCSLFWNIYLAYLKRKPHLKLVHENPEEDDSLFSLKNYLLYSINI